MDEQTLLLHTREDTGVLDRHSPATYEEAITATGYGKFHFLLLLMCGWALSSDAIEVMSISFVLPPATDDLNLSSADKGWITAIIFVGMMFGGYVWGVLADIRGRRSVLRWSLLVNGLGGLASSFSQTFWQFIILRFISGVGVGGSMPVIFAYYTEFQPKERRGSMISILATFWMSGNIVAAALAWLIIPHTEIHSSSDTFTYNSWQVFLAVCTIPAFTSIVLFIWAPESPKFLMEKGQERNALLVFKRMFNTNRKQHYAEYEILSLQIPTDDSAVLDLSDTCCSKMATTLRKSISSTAELFNKPYTVISVVLAIIYFTLSFGYYGLFLWFPELFNRMEKYGGSPCDLGTEPLNTTTSGPDVVYMNIYWENLLIAASNLPGNIFTICVIDRVGRKILLAGSMVISGLCVFFIALLQNKTDSLIMSCVFSGVSVIGWNTLDVLGVELFPTHLRSTATGLEMGIGRIGAILGNVVFGQLVNTYCLIPMFMVAVLLTVGGLSGIMLPKTTKIDLY